jgi:hypothetical protein
MGVRNVIQAERFERARLRPHGAALLQSGRANEREVVSAFEIKLHTAGVKPHAYLAALPMIAVRSGFLVTFADTRSDERFLAVVRNDGTVTRLRQLASPFALVRLSDDRKYLIGVRHRATPEIVFYACAYKDANA